MTWILVVISSYFIYAIVNLVDKYLLVGPLPSARVYAFYLGTLSILALFLIPLGFTIPNYPQLLLSLLAGAISIFAILGFFRALRLFEISRVLPAVGGLMPLFAFGLIYLFSGESEILSLVKLTAFILLIGGSVLIVYEKERSVTLKSFWLSAITALLYALFYTLSKYVYEAQPFWSGFIWIRIGAFLGGLFLLFSREVREEIFKKQATFKRKTAVIFLSNQSFAVGALVLQNWAIALVPLGLLPFINALEGTKYIFILILAVLISWKFPQILKEEVSKKVLLQKIIAILLIGGGLILLTLK